MAFLPAIFSTVGSFAPPHNAFDGDRPSGLFRFPLWEANKWGVFGPILAPCSWPQTKDSSRPPA